MSADMLRQLPSVSDLLIGLTDFENVLGHKKVTDTVRKHLQKARVSIRDHQNAPTTESLLDAVRDELIECSGQGNGVNPVINATGVIIHTNLGRVVLSQSAQKAVLDAAMSYQALEYDLETGQRGLRGKFTEQLVAQLSMAEDALVVNNCAAATILMLSVIAQGKAMVISRGELVEIGGGFRVPEIMTQSGARLIEVGTTNKTRIDDYIRAIKTSPDVAGILKVHPSNFKQVGFSEHVSLTDLTRIAAVHENRLRDSFVPVLHDLGSGAVLDTARFGISHEPTVQESVLSGVALTAFSGDKLFGGPQAGIIVGAKDYVDQCRHHPLARAFRADKLTLAALGATAQHYIRNEADTQIPLWRMMSATSADIGHRALAVVTRIQPWCEANNIIVGIEDGESTIGGGSLPGDTLKTVLISLHVDQATQLLRDLRQSIVPIIARIKSGNILIDLRTVLDDEELIRSLTKTAVDFSG